MKTNEDIIEKHQEIFEKLLGMYSIYDVGETGCGHWTDCSGEDNWSHEIDLHEAVDILKRIGTNYDECYSLQTEFENRLKKKPPNIYPT